LRVLDPRPSADVSLRNDGYERQSQNASAYEGLPICHGDRAGSADGRTVTACHFRLTTKIQIMTLPGYRPTVRAVVSL
jgi:hypothetical protein